MITLIQLSDVPDAPKAKLDLPKLLVGEKLSLRFALTRKNKGRSEILEVTGLYRVCVTHLEDSGTRQILSVESTGSTPHWRAVRTPPVSSRTMPPAKGFRFQVEG